MFILQLELNRFIILLKTVLEKLNRVKHIMGLMVLVEHLGKFLLVCFRDGFVENLEMSPCFWVKFLIHF
jgi:hypothetical protein